MDNSPALLGACLTLGTLVFIGVVAETAARWGGALRRDLASWRRNRAALRRWSRESGYRVGR